MNPYSKYLENRNALEILSETPLYLQAFAEKVEDEKLKKVWADGKWTGNEIILHLIHVETIFGNRIRYALTEEDYTVQPFEQDNWVKRESSSIGTENISLLISLRNFNLKLFQTLTNEEKSRTLNHPELGELKVGELLEVLAGHDLNHRQQLEIIKGNKK